MSTANKLDPNIRTRRTDRAAAVKELRKVRGEHQLLAAALADYIAILNKLPTLSAAVKHTAVSGIMREAREAGIL
jgi:hypothetical protein